MRRPGSRGTHSGGFTLVEVLVALVIVATSLAALGRAMLSGLDLERELKGRSCAQWIADDRLAFQSATYGWSVPGTRTGRTEQAGTVFVWREEVTPTPNSAFQRVEVSVAALGEPERILGRRVGFMFRKAG